MTQLMIDQFDFRTTANVVWHINPGAMDHWPSPQDLYEYMVKLAECEIGASEEACDHLVVAGFVLSSYMRDDIKHVRASVSSSLALSYLHDTLTLDSTSERYWKRHPIKAWVRRVRARLASIVLG